MMTHVTGPIITDNDSMHAVVIHNINSNVKTKSVKYVSLAGSWNNEKIKSSIKRMAEKFVTKYMCNSITMLQNVWFRNESCTWKEKKNCDEFKSENSWSGIKNIDYHIFHKGSTVVDNALHVFRYDMRNKRAHLYVGMPASVITS